MTRCESLCLKINEKKTDCFHLDVKPINIMANNNAVIVKAVLCRRLTHGPQYNTALVLVKPKNRPAQPGRA